MTKSVVILTILAVLFAGASFATPVSFTTAFAYAGGTGVVSGNQIIFGNLALTITGANNMGLNPPPPVGVPFLTIDPTCLVPGDCITPIPINGTLSFNVNQVVPFVDSSVSFSGALSGAIGANTGSGLLSFGPSSVLTSTTSDGLVQVFYSLQQPGNPNPPPAFGYILNATNLTDTTVQGVVNAVVIPEPGALVLLGSALIALGVMRRRM